MKVGVSQKRLKRVLRGTIPGIILLFPLHLSATVYQVSTANDAGVGSLRDAITQVNTHNAGGTDTIILGGNLAGQTINLASVLPPINITGSLLIDGTAAANAMISGQNAHAIFFVYRGNVDISTLTLNQGLSTGGAGGQGQGGGGGGMGAGGAVFVSGAGTGTGVSAAVTLTDVQVTNNAATGGGGGAVAAPIGGGSGGGGGMLSGAGGAGLCGGGSGGGLGATGTIGGATTPSAGTNGINGLLGNVAGGGGAGAAGTGVQSQPGGLGSTNAGSGGSGGGGQSGTGGGGGGGGIDGNNAVGAVGGAGGVFGGGGGSGLQGTVAVNGGYGGGGGGIGTAGRGPSLGGFGGGNGGSGAGGNGGSGFGGGIFVANGGSLTIINSNSSTAFSGNAVNAGVGVANGQALGGDLYFDTGALITFNVAAGKTQTIGAINQANSIAGTVGFTKAGAGTLILQGINTYTGTTVVNDGILQIDAQSASAGSIINNASVVFNTAPGTAGNFNGLISGAGSVTKQGDAGAITFAQAQTYTGGTNINNGTLQLTGVNFLATTAPVTLAANSALVTASQSQTIGDLTGAANSIVNLGGGASVFTFGTNNPTGTIFAGQIIGAGGSIVKQGTNTVTLSGNNTYGGTTTISAGSLKIATGGNIGSANPISLAGNTLLEMNGGTLNGNTPIQGVPLSQLLVTGAFTPGGAITNVPFINVNGGGTLTLGATSIPTGFTTFNVTGNATAGAVVALNANLPIPVGATMTLSGVLGNNSTGVALMAGTIQNSGSLVVSSNSFILSTTAQALQNLNGGVITYAGGVIDSPITGAGNSSILVTSTSGTGNTIDDVTDITVQAGTFTINNPVTNFTHLTIDAGAGLTLATNLNMNDAILDDNGTLNLSTFNLSGNAASTLNMTSNFNATGSITNVGTINVNGGTYTINANTSPTGFQQFNINAQGTLTLNDNFNLPINGTLTDNGTFNMAGFSLIGPAGNSTFIINVPFTASRPITNVQTITVGLTGNFTANTAPTGFRNMTVDGTLNLGTNLHVPNYAALTTNGTFNMHGHNLVMGTNSSLTINSALSTNGTITGDGSYTVMVNGPQGIFTVNNIVSGYGGFTVAAGGTVNLAAQGSLNGTINNNGIFNINSGTLVTGDIIGIGILNINSAFTPPGLLQMGSININAGGILTTENLVTTTAGTTITTGGTLVLNNDLSGALVHQGALLNPSGNSHTITGDYTMAGTATRTVEISTSNMDTLVVNGNATINGGTVIVDLPDGGGDIGYEQAFNMVSVNGFGNVLTVNPLPTVVVPHSLLVRFDPVQNGNNFQLVSRFIPMVSELNQEDPGLDNMAVVLDSMRGSSAAHSLGNVYGAIDSVETPEELQELLSELAPLGRNMETVAATYAIQNLMSDKILGRMSDLRTAGYSGGDMASGMSSYGPFVFGNGLRQGTRNGVAGYNANTGGFGFLWDTPVMQTSRIGVAAAYGASVVRQDDQTRNIVKINNVTGMIYGNADYGPLFLDGLLSAGRNYYLGKRNITSLGLTASSHYQGMQYGGKLRGGFTLPVYTLEISPMATGQYVFMTTQRYTEESAPGANLTVADSHVDNLQIGLGARIAEVSQADDFLPEIHALYLYDIKPARLQVSSQFATGGTSFITTGPLPSRAGFNIGGSMTAKMGEDFIFIGGYDLETKKSFVSQSLTFKFRWLF